RLTMPNAAREDDDRDASCVGCPRDGLTTREAANPQAPLAMTRTPKPKLVSSETPGTSRILPPPRSGDIRQGDVLIAIAVDTDIAIGGFELPGFPQGAVGELVEIPGRRSRGAAEQCRSQ